MHSQLDSSESISLLIGFDSAWLANNRGAIVGVVRRIDGTYQEIGTPAAVTFDEAADTIVKWQLQERATETLVLLDQPTIVRNSTSQRPVENLVASSVSRRYGGMQPANTSRIEMFGLDAPVWSFLNKFGGPTYSPTSPGKSRVFETYPVATMIALDWILSDAKRPTGRLPKYNPDRRKTFSLHDWAYVCDRVASEFSVRNLFGLVSWLGTMRDNPSPRKAVQDALDACICLVTAFFLAEGKDCLMVGDVKTGFIMVPYGEDLHQELEIRCKTTGRDPQKWIKIFHAGVS